MGRPGVGRLDAAGGACGVRWWIKFVERERRRESHLRVVGPERTDRLSAVDHSVHATASEHSCDYPADTVGAVLAEAGYGVCSGQCAGRVLGSPGVLSPVRAAGPTHEPVAAGPAGQNRYVPILPTTGPGVDVSEQCVWAAQGLGYHRRHL